MLQVSEDLMTKLENIEEKTETTNNHELDSSTIDFKNESGVELQGSAKKKSPKKKKNNLRKEKESWTSTPDRTRKLKKEEDHVDSSDKEDRPLKLNSSLFQISKRSREKETPKNTTSTKTEHLSPIVEGESNEITIKEESFYGHLNGKDVDPNLSKLGKFELEEGFYKCDICDYKSDQKKHAFVHKLTVHVKLKLECDVCEDIFTDPRSLKKHKTSKHEDIRYECDKCSKTTSTAYHLASHKRRKHS